MAALIVVLACAFAWAPAARADTVTSTVDESPAAVRDYWTMKRMLAAGEAQQPPASVVGAAPDSARTPDPGPVDASYVPAAGSPAALRDGPPPQRTKGGSLGIGVERSEIADPSAPESRMHGKVFFTIPAGPEAGDYVCSGTAVNSRNRSVVWTAGHCVFDLESGNSFATNWIFVPGFSVEGEPFGEWPAKRLATTTGWKASSNIRYDLGAAVVTKNATGQRLQEVVGARGIGFDQPRDQNYAAYGYPAEAPPLEFTGSREFRCVSGNVGADSPVGSGPSTMAIDCDMTGGASGGGWVSGTTLLSVVSYGYAIEPTHLYGPYMSAGAKALYRNVSGNKKKKKGGKGGKG